MLRVPVAGDGLLHHVHLVHPGVCGEHSVRRVEPPTAPAARARGQPHLHEHGYVLHALRHRKPRRALRHCAEASGAPAAVNRVQLGVHPVHILGGRGHVHLQAGPVLRGAGEHRTRRATAVGRRSVLPVLLDNDQQSLQGDEDVLQREFDTHLNRDRLSLPQQHCVTPRACLRVLCPLRLLEL